MMYLFFVQNICFYVVILSKLHCVMVEKKTTKTYSRYLPICIQSEDEYRLPLMMNKNVCALTSCVWCLVLAGKAVQHVVECCVVQSRDQGEKHSTSDIDQWNTLIFLFLCKKKSIFFFFLFEHCEHHSEIALQFLSKIQLQFLSTNSH